MIKGELCLKRKSGVFFLHYCYFHMPSLFFINITRYAVLILSLFCLGCHFTQCFLLSKYQQKVGKTKKKGLHT